MYIGSSFTILPPVPETGCPIGHTGLTVDKTLKPSNALELVSQIDFVERFEGDNA